MVPQCSKVGQERVERKSKYDVAVNSPLNIIGPKSQLR
jgi:hypothetical protein